MICNYFLISLYLISPYIVKLNYPYISYFVTSFFLNLTRLTPKISYSHFGHLFFFCLLWLITTKNCVNKGGNFSLVKFKVFSK